MNQNREGMTLHQAEQRLHVHTVREDQTSIDFTSGLPRQNIEDWLNPDSVVVVDDAVARLYAQWVDEIREKAKTVFTLNGGDSHKDLAHVQQIIDSCVQAKLSRRGTLVGVGGGVTTDTTGLAANLYYRGINAEYVPTTLLSMVDAAIGGKVGVNHPSHKNLIGSFYQPQRVIVDEGFIGSQSSEQILSGFGEILKIAMVASEKLFALLENCHDLPDLMRNHVRAVIRSCIEHKIQMLGANCYERSFDRILNFGHSVAHPLEDVSHFRIPHGIAVGQGIAVASHIAKERRIFPDEQFQRLLRVMQKLGLPLFDKEVDEKEVWEHVQQLILQRGGKSLYYVMPKVIGEAITVDNISPEEFTAAVKFLRD